MPNYTAVLRAHITLTINADDEQDFFRRLRKWRDANPAKRYGRTVPAVVTMVPGMPLVALDHQKMPLRPR